MSTTSQAQDRRSTHRAMLPVVMLALATVVSAVASLNVALPSIARDTHATQTQLSWVIDAYALVFAALLLLGGAVGDRYGRRRALVAGLVIFGGGSLPAMVVSDPSWLIALRGVLGLGAALVMPATLSTITSTFPDEQRNQAVGACAGRRRGERDPRPPRLRPAAAGVVLAGGVRAERRPCCAGDPRRAAFHP